MVPIVGNGRSRNMVALLSGTCLGLMAAATPARAQTAPPARPADAPQLEGPQQPGVVTAATKSDNAEGAPSRPSEGTGSDIVVTGSRISAAGFNAPTPTTVLSIEQLQQAAQPNLFDAITELPTLQGSSGTANRAQNGGTSAGSNGLSALNLRNLGTIRTLVLLDGQRVVPAYITGIADVSQFPQLLTKRVDVVTGGASASWGSDAVAGVVNFVTDTKFKGFKANISGGISTYGDDQSILAQVAGGVGLMGDRLHVEGSLEYYKNKGVPGGNVGGSQQNGRPDDYRSATTSYALGAQPAGAPQYYAYPYDAQQSSLGRYGLITAGPLAGTGFAADGSLYAFQYGTGCVSAVCQGGQQDNLPTATATIDNPIDRKVGYGRIGFDLTPTWELYGTATVARVQSENSPLAFPRKPAGLTVLCSNPFLAATAIPARCAAAGITSFQFGTSNANFTDREIIKSDRQQYRFVVGTDGSFNIGGKAIKFDAYYQHGTNKSYVNLYNITLNAKYNAAVAASRNAAGQIVCTSTVAQAQGCIPINIFTGTPISKDQFTYLTTTHGPYQHSTFKEDAASLSFNATPFSLWAGDVAVAFGAEYRKEFYVVTADPYGNGVAADSPNTADYPADALLATGGNNWYAGNYHNGTGTFHVKEAFLEIGLPLLDSQSLGKVAVNLAGREARYSTSGKAETWKVGGTWETPLEGLRLRSVYSRDLRAPNLSELFAAPQTANQPVINRATGGSVQVVIATIGNPNLKPEIGYTFEGGFAYRPSFLRGVNVSVDYYNIRVRGQIGTLTSQQTVDLCYNGNTSYCPNVKFTGVLGTADYPFVVLQPFNLASTSTRGIDFEASYQTKIGGAAKLVLRGLATRSLDYISDTGIVGQQVSQLAGQNTDGGVPRWKGLFSQALDIGPATFNLTERYVSPGKINVNAITCAIGSCPLSTVQNPTYNFNYIPGAVLLEFGASVRPTASTQIYFKVDNIFNHRAPPFGGSSLYDIVGRQFRLGARISM